MALRVGVGASRARRTMLTFFAHFKDHEGHRFRLDTRIYLGAVDEPRTSDPCVAAIVAKNPGSAKGTASNGLIALSLDGDKLLPYVGNRFLAAYERAGVEPPDRGYIRVWNLFYLCDPNLKRAIECLGTVGPQLCLTEGEATPPVVWFAWGPPNPQLERFTLRFVERAFKEAFYFDMKTKAIVPHVPTTISRVKHTQGLPAEPVEKHLSNIIRSFDDLRRGVSLQKCREGGVPLSPRSP
jgi:hypothetical protein